MKRSNQLTIKIPVEFNHIFFRLCRVNYKRVLKLYSRDQIIRTAVLLNREYCNQDAYKLCYILSSTDSRVRKIYKRISKFKKSKSCRNAEYVVSFENMSLELLRMAFSIKANKFSSNRDKANIDSLQYKTLKLITQVNEKLMKYRISKIHKNDLPVLTYINSASSYDILYFNMQNEYLYQLILAYEFFKLIEANAKYKVLLNEFYNKYQIESWREYIRTVLSVITLSVNHEGYIPNDLSIDPDSLMSKSVLDELSIPYDIENIPYECKNEYDIIGNSDYKVFRDKPLFKLSNGNYAVHSRPLITDRLYSSLYFDFKAISESLSVKHPDISNLFTSEFIEKTLFSGSIKSCINHNKCTAKNEEELKAIHKIVNGELGYPDYYILESKGIILFECKDIRLNAWIKEQRNFELLEQELRNKLVRKTYQLDYKSRSHKIIKAKRIGCGQIAGHLANIRKSAFMWDTTLDKNVPVYPVLIIADNRLLATGLSNILQRWFEECLIAEGMSPENEKRLIIMSPLTLIKYSYLFKTYGFAKYFEEYYRSIARNQNDGISQFNRLISFEDYMSKHPFNLQSFSNKIIEELKKNHTYKAYYK